jgi:two-component system response regulator AtoC
MRELFRIIDLVADTDATVLIRGERGTGKELVAAAVHRLSRRGAAAFVPIDCGALPHDLLASELFGHERGAFTGAIEKRPGLFVVAHGGTLFADEIGNLSMEGQAKLLRAIEEREIRPVGARAATRVDVRLIAATNKDLRRAVRDNTFMPDLYDRLDEIVLAVPSLRARREDIPLLVEHFLAVHQARHARAVRGVSREAWRVLQGHAWPGNVRQLGRAVSRGVIFAAGDWIRPGHLQLDEGDTSTDEHVHVDGDGRAVRLTVRQREAMDLARRHGSVRRGDLVTRFGVSGEAARRDLVALRRAGLLRHEYARGVSRYLLADASMDQEADLREDLGQ